MNFLKRICWLILYPVLGASFIGILLFFLLSSLPVYFIRFLFYGYNWGEPNYSKELVIGWWGGYGFRLFLYLTEKHALLLDN